MKPISRYAEAMGAHLRAEEEASAKRKALLADIRDLLEQLRERVQAADKAGIFEALDPQRVTIENVLEVWDV